MPFDTPEELAEVGAEMLANMPADAYPHLTAVATELPASGFDHGSELEIGLDLVLDGVARLDPGPGGGPSAGWHEIWPARHRPALGELQPADRVGQPDRFRADRLAGEGVLEQVRGDDRGEVGTDVLDPPTEARCSPATWCEPPFQAREEEPGEGDERIPVHHRGRGPEGIGHESMIRATHEQRVTG